MCNAIIGVTRIRADNITADNTTYMLDLTADFLKHNPETKFADVQTYVERTRFVSEATTKDTYAVFLAAVWVEQRAEFVLNLVFDTVKLIGKVSEYIDMGWNKIKLDHLTKSFEDFKNGRIAIKRSTRDDIFGPCEIDQKHVIIALNEHSIVYEPKISGVKSRDNIFYLSL